MPRQPLYGKDSKEVKDILSALRLGNTRADACQFAGISSNTFYRWLKKYHEFAREVELAEVRVVVAASAALTRASADDPKWAAYILRIKRPKEWREIHRLDVRELDKLPLTKLLELYAEALRQSDSSARLGTGDLSLGTGLETEGLEPEDVEDAIFNES